MAVNPQKLRELPGNKQCADCQDCDCIECGFPDPVWACAELGILVCEECMDLHSTLTRASFKSIMCQDWTEENFKIMAATSNDASKAIYEKHLSPAYKKPTRCFDPDFRRQWIVSKYVRKEFMKAETMPSYLEGRKSGYLWKLGRDSQVFQRRWFVLDPTGRGKLRYFTDANEQTLRGEILLFKMNMVLASEEKIGHPHGLQIVFPDNKGQNTRMIYLYAELAKDMVEWFQAIRCLKYNIQKMKPVGKDETLLRRILQYDILKEGYLLKTGAKGKEAFRKRWFVLDKLCLMYFKDPLDANPKGTIPLKDGYSLIVSGQVDPENRGFHFFLKTPGRLYHFIAESDHERKAWFSAIHAACNRASGVHNRRSKVAMEKAAKQLAAYEASRSGQTKPEAQGSPKPGKASTSATVKSADSQLASEEETEILSKPFEGVRASTKPRPQHTLGNYHAKGAGAGAGGGGGHRRFQQAGHKQQATAVADEGEDLGEVSSDTEDSSEEEDDDEEEEEEEEAKVKVEEESPYIELDGENVVMMKKVDVVGMTTKQLSTHLKVPPRALSPAANCTMCLSLVWNAQPKLPQSEGCVSVSPVVSCVSMPRSVALLQPFQLEVQHSAILRDVAACKPSIWHLNKEPGKFSRWEKAQEESTALTCRASHRNFIVETAKTGCFAIMVPSASVAGKILRSMAYTSMEQADDSLVVRVYFFDDNGSDDVLHEIQRREGTYRGHLCDISGSFFLANSNDNLKMTMTDMQGMEMYFSSIEPMEVTTEELLHKPMVCYIVEIIKKSDSGQCTINIWQENTPLAAEPVQMHLQFSNEVNYPVIAPAPYLSTYRPLPAVMPVRSHQALARVSSEPLSKKNAPLLAHRPRDDRHARSMPSRNRATGAGAGAAVAVGGLGLGLGSPVLPFPVKRDLFQLLDPKVAAGNDWRMLASQLGLDAMIYTFDEQVNPTAEVLRAFEVMGRPLAELEDYLRHMGRNDAADVLKTYQETLDTAASKAAAKE